MSDWHPIHLFLISVCASCRMKMNAAERVYEFHCCSGHGTRSDASKGAKRAPFLRDCLRRDARRRGRRFPHVLPARPQRCGATRYAECFPGLRPWRSVFVGCHLRGKVFEFAVSHDPHNPKVGSSNPPIDLNYPETIFQRFSNPQSTPQNCVSCAMSNDLGGPWQSPRAWKLLKKLVLNARGSYDTITTQ